MQSRDCLFRQEGLPPKGRVALTAPEAAVRATRSERLNVSLLYQMLRLARIEAKRRNSTLQTRTFHTISLGAKLWQRPPILPHDANAKFRI